MREQKLSAKANLNTQDADNVTDKQERDSVAKAPILKQKAVNSPDINSKRDTYVTNGSTQYNYNPSNARVVGEHLLRK